MAKPLLSCVAAYCMHKFWAQRNLVCHDREVNNYQKWRTSFTSTTTVNFHYMKDDFVRPLLFQTVRTFVKDAHCDGNSNSECNSCKSEKSCSSCQTKETWKSSQNGNVLKTPKMKKLLKKIKSLTSKEKYNSELEKHFLAAVRFASEQSDLNAIIHVQDMWANYCMLVSNMDKAEILLRALTQNLIFSGLDTDDPAVIKASLKLATIYAYKGKHELAAAGYSWSAKSCRDRLKRLEKGSPDYLKILNLLGMVLDSYARYSHLTGKNTEALRLNKEALEISQEVFGEKSSHAMLLYNSIATVYAAMGDNENALVNVNLAEQLAGSEGVSNEERAVILHNYGYILCKLSRIPEAQLKLKESLSYTSNEHLRKEIDLLQLELGKKSLPKDQ